MTHFFKTTALIAAFAPAMAAADSISLDAPLEGASLHAAGVDMTVYYLTLESGAFEVVATYAAQDATAEPQRLVMALQDGDDTRFGLPGHVGTLYTFERDDAKIIVSATPSDQENALETAPSM